VTTGTNRAFVRSSSRLFEFDQTGKYVREMGQGLYGFIFAHAVRVDPQDNIWVIDEGSNMVIKFDPDGHVIMTMGRKPRRSACRQRHPDGRSFSCSWRKSAGRSRWRSAREGAGPGPAREGADGPEAPTGAGAPGDNFDRPTMWLGTQPEIFRSGWV